MNKLEEEFKLYDETSAWTNVYQKIRQASQHDFSVQDAKRPEYKERNRYRDVSPYDHSRVRLERNHLDYINASLVEYPEASRSYILTQGPLPKTSSHFWLMVWEQNSEAVLMLNRVVEMGRIKCHQYFPMNTKDREELVFEDVGLRVIYVSEEDASFYVIRTLEIEDLETGKRKKVLQFHYTTWPDFGVPDSPEEFLKFLFAVRKAGVLERSVGPAVIHCSAGIGRSGTFCLVDTCLLLIEKNQDPNSVDVCDILMEMRRYRMGLIQTADQLRFSYKAIIEGCKHVLTTSGVDSSLDNRAIHQGVYSIDNNDQIGSVMSDEIITNMLSPNDNNNPPITKTEINDVSHNPGHTVCLEDNNISAADFTTTGNVSASDEYGHVTNGSTEMNEDGNSLSNQDMMADTMEMEQLLLREQSTDIRRRRREERKKKTAEQIAQMKRKQQECERWKMRKQQFGPYLWGASIAVLVASYLMYKYYVT